MCVCVSCLLGMMVPMIHKSMAAGSEFLVGALLKARPGRPQQVKQDSPITAQELAF